MKKIFSILIMGLALPLRAAFIQEAPAVINVIEVKELKDDTPIVIQGNIIQQLESDKYLFKDETDEVIVEIDSKAWNGVDVRATDVIQLVGKVDKDFADDVEIDVDKVVPLKNIQ